MRILPITLLLLSVFAVAYWAGARQPKVLSL